MKLRRPKLDLLSSAPHATEEVDELDVRQERAAEAHRAAVEQLSAWLAEDPKGRARRASAAVAESFKTIKLGQVAMIAASEQAARVVLAAMQEEGING